MDQVRAPNLALISVELEQRDGKEAVAEDGDVHSSNALKDKLKPPPTEPPLRKEWPPPCDYYREEDDDYTDTWFHPRPHLESPIYDGEEDPLPWLHHCETFFHGQNTPGRCRVWYASMHLSGATQFWFYRLELTASTPSWRRFMQLVQQRFGPLMTDGPVGEIMLLHCTGTVEEYTDMFLALACRDADLTES